MIALQFWIRRPEPLAGIVGISGILVAPEQLEAEIKSRPPVLLIHGTDDGVEKHVSPGAGHSVGQDGLAVSTAFAVRVLS